MTSSERGESRHARRRREVRGAALGSALVFLFWWRAAQAQDPPLPPAVPTPPVAVDTSAEQQRQIAAFMAELADQRAEIQKQAALVDAALGANEDQGKEPPFRVYGFMDMGTNSIKVDGQQNVILPSKATHFVLGNVNLYFDAVVDQHWSALTEIRFTTLPNGANDILTDLPQLGVNLPKTNTKLPDSTSPTPWASVTLGSIVMERAYLQYTHNDKLKLRMGYFLTPFGIWNIDHGIPTLISMTLPQLEVNEMIPLRQLGVELLGNLREGSWDIGYFAYVSNGRGDAIPDPTNDKMFGGRVYARTNRPFWMTFGLSGLTGNFADERRALQITGNATTVQRTDVTAFHENVVGADVSLDAGPLRIRSELAYRTIAYDVGKRDLAFGQAGTYSPDGRIIDWYVLAAYQLPWWGLEPYGYFELYHFPTVIGDGLSITSGGLNVHFTPQAQLKFQYAVDQFYDNLTHFSGKLSTGQRFITRFVLAF